MKPKSDIGAGPVPTCGPGVATNDEAASPAEGLTGTGKSVLDNPVLPSDFDFLVPKCAVKGNWEFASKNPVLFRKAWRGFETFPPIKAL